MADIDTQSRLAKDGAPKVAPSGTAVDDDRTHLVPFAGQPATFDSDNTTHDPQLYPTV
jgi:hypothetical protein